MKCAAVIKTNNSSFLFKQRKSSEVHVDSTAPCGFGELGWIYSDKPRRDEGKASGMTGTLWFPDAFPKQYYASDEGLVQRCGVGRVCQRFS